MHPTTLNILERDKNLLPLLVKSRHFHISAGIDKVAAAITMHEASRDTGFTFPKMATLPAQDVWLTGDGFQPTEKLGHSAFGGLAYALSSAPDGSVRVTFYSAAGGSLYLGRFWPGVDKLDVPSAEAFVELSSMHAMMRVSMILSLMNEPRRVTVARGGEMQWPRQHRRRLERLTGKPALAYSTVTWQVGAGVRAKGNPDGDTDLKVALHWCRAHWRRADEKHPRSEWIQPYFAKEAGWYTWVRDCWKGHPDHGIKLQRHEPKMIGERRKGAVVPEGVPNAVKLTAMSAQQRAMMVQAGFAPSAMLH